MDTAHLPIPRTNSELDHVKGSSDSGEKVDEERLSQAPYQNLQTHVHELESTRAYKMARWKIDFLVTGMGMLLYFLAFLDKANLGNAKVAGLETDLKLTSFQYSVALTILYPPYIAVELPSNLLVKRIGAHRLLPIMTIAFGLVCCLQGKVESYGGLLAARFFLGLAEGGLIPGIVMWVSTWYKRSEMQLRLAWIFSFISLAGAFAGLLAAAILTLDGVHGVAGWRWVFYIEGAMAIGVGLLAPFVMSADVSTAWFLTKEEKEIILTVHEAGGKNVEMESHLTKQEVYSFFKSFFGMTFLPAFFCNGCILFGMSYFLPTVVATFGYSRIQTQLHTVPIYAVVFVCTMVASYLSDKFKVRGVQFVVFGTISMIGYIIALVVKKEQNKLVSNQLLHKLMHYVNRRYAALFLQIFGGPGLSPGLSAWMVDNVAPYYKRSTAIAIAFIFTQGGGILSTWIYPSKDAPLFHTGAGVSLMSAIVLVVTGAGLSLFVIRENRKKAAIMRNLSMDHVFPPGPIDNTDPRYHYVP